MIKGDGWLEWWRDRGESFSETFLPGELGYTYNYIITPYPNAGWILDPYSDEWEANGVKFLVGQNGEFILNEDHYNKYPDNTTFTYTLQPLSSMNHKITIKPDRWFDNTGWTQDVGGSKVGFSQSNLSSTDKTMTVSHGEQITVYAQGADGFHSYPNDQDHWYYQVAGFYNESHVAYKIGAANNSGIDSYTFTVNGDMTIYVDFRYISQ